MPTSEPVAEPIGRRERNKAEKHRRIMAAARKLFNEQGFPETTTAQISDQAGVGTGTLYLYFGSKEELLVEVFTEDMGRVWGDAFDEVDRSRPLSEQFAWVFDQVSGHHLRNPGLARVYLKEMVFLSESQRQGTAQFLTMFHDRMTGLMVEAQGRGRLRDDVPLAVLSQNLFAIWLSVIRRSLSVDASRHEVGEMLRRSLAVAMLGLECPG